MKFMERKGYKAEARYIKVVNGWRQSCDERGLSELTRCQLNYDFLNYILDDLMPWHCNTYDLSLLEVNRYIQEGESDILHRLYCILFCYFQEFKWYLWLHKRDTDSINNKHRELGTETLFKCKPRLGP